MSQADAWSRIVSWFETHAPDELELLRPPVAAKDIAAAEAAIGTALPPRVVAWYRRNDGASGVNVWIAGYSFLRLSDAMGARRQWIENIPAPSTWLPIADAHGGDAYVLDLTSGAIVEVARGERAGVVAPDIDAFLELYARELEAGHYHFDDEGLVHRDFEGPGMLGHVPLEAPVGIPALVERLASRSRPPTDAEWATLRAATPDELFDALAAAGKGATTLIATALGRRGEAWARALLGSPIHERPDFRSAVRIAAACLTAEEALEWAWANRPPHNIDLPALGALRSQLLLDRMEADSALSPAAEWARAVFEAGLDWPRAKRWIAGGRPLSLIALDALALPAMGSDKPAPIAVPSGELRPVLDAGLAADGVSRVRKAIAAIEKVYR